MNHALDQINIVRVFYRVLQSKLNGNLLSVNHFPGIWKQSQFQRVHFIEQKAKKSIYLLLIKEDCSLHMRTFLFMSMGFGSGHYREDQDKKWLLEATADPK